MNNHDILQDNTPARILEKLHDCSFKVSTDTRKDVTGSIYFALSGENFDGNRFIGQALQNGAIGAVTDNPQVFGDNIFFVENVLLTLQYVASEYRKQFTIPLIAIGGSNGKTTSKELTLATLATKYRVHATEGSLNNHIGVPLSILSMPRNTEIGVFEIGANHPGEHTELLEILKPTHLVVTNNGMDHLEGFGTPEGSRKANAELYDWAHEISSNHTEHFVTIPEHSIKVFVDKTKPDLIADSEQTEQIFYPTDTLEIIKSTPLILNYEDKLYETNIAGDYNIENIHLALAIGHAFSVDTQEALQAICQYIPSSKRSQLLNKNGIHFIVDCYNANPSSMMASLQSFFTSTSQPRGLVLGDMLELGSYSEAEHEKIVDFILEKNIQINCIVFIGEHFRKALETRERESIHEINTYQYFPNSISAQDWFQKQNFTGFTFLLKGSRGIMVEKIME